jgi:cell division initiation protein
MKLLPFEIRSQEFPKSIRGYDPAEVKAFLEQVAAVIDEQLRQIKDLSQKVTELESQVKEYKSAEKALQQTFIQAQETSGKAIESARREAQLVIQEAEMKASHVVEKAQNDLTELRDQAALLTARKVSIVERLKMLLSSELDLLKAMEVEEEAQSSSDDSLEQGQSKATMEIEDILKSLDSE